MLFSRHTGQFCVTALAIAVIAVSASAGHAKSAPAASPKPAAAKPAAPAAPSVKVEKGKVYGDWGTYCETPPNGNKQCFISQVQLNPKGGQQVLKISVGYLGPKGEPMVVAMLPLGISIPAGAAFKIDEETQHALNLQSCMPDGCIGNLILDKDTMKQILGGKTMRVGIVPVNDHSTITINVSMNGFKDGFNALQAP